VGHGAYQPVQDAPRAGALYSRHQGGLLSRALGTAVHSLLEEFARLRLQLDEQAARQALPQSEARIAAEVRGLGIELRQSAQIAAQALSLALAAAQDATGAWILSPHPGAASEAGWTGVVAGSLRTVRPDRVFQAGPAPGAEGDHCWWIIDYKTAQVEAAAALPELRKLFAPQVEAYAEILRHLHGKDVQIRLGLYYPRMLLLDWWER
jgi:ATP-dependent exoDNAse (exonuclease V) beta subunit